MGEDGENGISMGEEWLGANEERGRGGKIGEEGDREGRGRDFSGKGEEWLGEIKEKKGQEL